MQKLYLIRILLGFCLFSLSLAGSSILIDSPESLQARSPKWKGLDVSFLSESVITDVKKYKAEIEAMNYDQSVTWRRKVWNIDSYSEKNLPVIINSINNTDAFSSRYEKVGLRFLDLPIHMPGQGWRIPMELEQFCDVIKMAVDHERICVSGFEKNHYVYITVDQGWVDPLTNQRRAGWHGDSYRKINTKKQKSNILVDHVYIIYDSCPTIFVSGPFSFKYVDPENIDEVMTLFANQAKDMTKMTYPPYTLLQMNPYCIHDAGVNTTDKPIFRTFVKISFSKVKYAHLGNAHNHLFTYDWPLVPRIGVPYTKEAIALSAHRKDRDKFLEIDPTEIDFLNKQHGSFWAQSTIFTVLKSGEVYAEPAKAGELLGSKDKAFLVTINVAEKGDYKVKFSDGYVGFMSQEKFNNLYNPVENRPGWYIQKKMLRRAVQLTTNVRMKAPWGTLQYAREGDYLIYITEDDMYFVPKDIFESTYEILD